jgi:hypothetical protein
LPVLDVPPNSGSATPLPSKTAARPRRAVHLPQPGGPELARADQGGETSTAPRRRRRIRSHAPQLHRAGGSASARSHRGASGLQTACRSAIPSGTLTVPAVGRRHASPADPRGLSLRTSSRRPDRECPFPRRAVVSHAYSRRGVYLRLGRDGEVIRVGSRGRAGIAANDCCMPTVPDRIRASCCCPTPSGLVVIAVCRPLSACMSFEPITCLRRDVGAEAVLVEGERLEAVVDRQGVREWQPSASTWRACGQAARASARRIGRTRQGFDEHLAGRRIDRVDERAAELVGPLEDLAPGVGEGHHRSPPIGL